jgi:hypothetical protein
VGAAEQLHPPCLAERGRDPDVTEHVLVVVEAEQQRVRQRPVDQQPEAGDDAVGRVLALDLHHAPPAGLVTEVAMLRDDAVDAAMKPGEERGEVEFGLGRDHDLAVEHKPALVDGEERLDGLGKVARERPLRLRKSTSAPSRNARQRKPSHFGS